MYVQYIKIYNAQECAHKRLLDKLNVCVINWFFLYGRGRKNCALNHQLGHLYRVNSEVNVVIPH